MHFKAIKASTLVLLAPCTTWAELHEPKAQPILLSYPHIASWHRFNSHLTLSFRSQICTPADDLTVFATTAEYSATLLETHSKNTALMSTCLLHDLKCLCRQGEKKKVSKKGNSKRLNVSSVLHKHDHMSHVHTVKESLRLWNINVIFNTFTLPKWRRVQVKFYQYVGIEPVDIYAALASYSGKTHLWYGKHKMQL